MKDNLSLIEKELKKVKYADLSTFDINTNTYFIKKRNDIKIEEDKSYLIYLEDSFFNDLDLKIKWNSNLSPNYRCLKVVIDKLYLDMVKISGIAYDLNMNKDIAYVWSGWSHLNQIKVLQKL